MTGASVESKSERQDSISDIDEPVSRSDFLKKLIAGGAISVAAISGLGGLEKAFGQAGPQSSSSGPSVEDLVQQVAALTKQLNTLQTQFNGLINGTIPADKLVANQINVSDIAPYKEKGGLTLTTDSLYLKSQNSDFDYSKFGVGENYFLKIDGIDGLTAKKCNVADIAA